MKKYVFEYETDISLYNNPIVITANCYFRAVNLARSFVSPDCCKAWFTPTYKVYSSGRVFNRSHKQRYILTRVTSC